MKKKIVSYILTTFLLILLILTFIFTQIFEHQHEERIKTDLRQNSIFINNMIKANNNKYEDVLFQENFSDIPIRVTYIDNKGDIVFDSDAIEGNMDNHANRPEVIEANIDGEAFNIRYSKTIGKNMIYYALKTQGDYIIRSSLPLDTNKLFDGVYFKYYLLAILLIIIIAIWFSNKLAFIIVKPIEDLDEATSIIAKGNLNRRVRINSDDEIGKLGQNFNDMTEKLEESLNDALDKQNRLEAILKSMNSGVIAVDKDFDVIMINPYANEIFGIKQNIVGKNLIKNIRDFELENVFSSDDEYTEIRIYYPNERVLRIKTTDIINGKDHIGTVAVVQDITDFKKLENMRRQFVANVTHELKTPLTSIKGFSETLKDVEEIEIRNKFLNIINDEAERLTRLINDILVLSNIEQQKAVKKDENIDINKVIIDVYNLLKGTAENKSVFLEMECQEVRDLKGERDKLKQMLINLVDNSIKYSDPEDVVTIGVKENEKAIIISVSDTGPGIPKEHIPRLFERFYRVDKARSRAKGGTGLGLAIVKHIVILFNGTITVNSELGVGSEFIVTIPFNN